VKLALEIYDLNLQIIYSQSHWHWIRNKRKISLGTTKSNKLIDNISSQSSNKLMMGS
jgi:hypothetical protein